MHPKIRAKILDIVANGSANLLPRGADNIRTFTFDGKAVTLAISKEGIVATNGAQSLGIIGKNSSDYRGLYLAINAIEVPDIVEADADDEEAQAAQDAALDALLTQGAKTVSKVRFMQLFTVHERIDIEDFQNGDEAEQISIDKIVRSAMALLDEAENIDLAQTVVSEFLGYLTTLDSPNRVDVTVMTPERVARVLSGQEPEVVAA